LLEQDVEVVFSLGGGGIIYKGFYGQPGIVTPFTFDICRYSSMHRLPGSPIKARLAPSVRRLGSFKGIF